MDNRIKEILSKKGMTAKELAVIVGVSSVSLYNIINGSFSKYSKYYCSKLRSAILATFCITGRSTAKERRSFSHLSSLWKKHKY